MTVARVRQSEDFDIVEKWVDDNCEATGYRRTHDDAVCQLAFGCESDVTLAKIMFPKEIVW